MIRNGSERALAVLRTSRPGARANGPLANALGERCGAGWRASQMGCRTMAAVAAVTLLGGMGGTHAQQSAAAGEAAGAVAAASHQRLQSTLVAFLASPIDSIAALMAGFELGGLREADARRIALYTEVMASEIHSADSHYSSVSDISMVYVGLTDGNFLGFYDVNSLVTRPAGNAAAADCSWAQFDLATVNEQCAASPSCAPGPTVSASSSNLRIDYSTSRQLGGTAISLTGWKEYDHRAREWYTDRYFALKMMNFALKMMNPALKMMHLYHMQPCTSSCTPGSD